MSIGDQEEEEKSWALSKDLHHQKKSTNFSSFGQKHVAFLSLDANIDFIKHGVGETAFLPSEPIEVNIAKGLSIEQDLSVSPGTPTLRIASIQPTASDIRLLTNEQSAAQVRQGDQNRAV